MTLLRTRKTRPVGGALVLTLALVASVGVGAVSRTAQADEAATPSPTATATPSPVAPTSSGATNTSGTNTSGQTPRLASTLQQALGVPDAVDDYFVLKRGLTESINVAANDSCPPSQPASPSTDACTYAVGQIPAGWGASMTPQGVLTVWVPGKTVPGAYPLTYTVTNGNPLGQDTATVAVAVTPDNFNPPAGMTFTHPYRSGYRTLIRTQVLRAINSAPSGSRIRLASWSFAGQAYRVALRDAKARGVTVQIVLAARNTRQNSDWLKLARIFGTSVTPDGTWVRKCSYSCRGTSGTMHSKIFLFSQVYRTPQVEMTGSANLTDFAVTNQWNQMNTVVNNQPVWDEAVRVFNEMAADRPAPYVEGHYGDIWTYYYPHGRVIPANDFMMDALAPVRCTGAVNAAPGGRTIVKIAMYAWYQYRGQWLARRVRQLWDQGCRVQIVFGIMSNNAKQVLYSPRGRGRIPMRQILLTNTHQVPIYYLHDKWVAITGNYGGNPSSSVSLQGSFNFSDMGFGSDEQFQLLRGRAVYNRFARDFRLLWTDRQSRAPSPISTIPVIEGRYSQNDLRLGTGVYRYMQAD